MKFRAIILLVVILAVLHFSCNKGVTIQNMFRYNEMGDVTSLDPAVARSFENNWVDNQLYNGLLEADENLKLKPSIAKRWTISNDGLTLTFILRNDVCFHEDISFPSGKGRRVRANDFVYSFIRLYDPKISDAIPFLDVINKDFPGSTQGYTAVNDSTFVIHLKKRFIPFLYVLSMKFFSVVPKEAVEHYGSDFSFHPVGTGPFKFLKWAANEKLILLKNEYYFEKDSNGVRLPYLDGVSVSFIKDPETSFLEFMEGNSDMLSGMAAINPKVVLDNQGVLRKEFADRVYMQKTPFIKTDYLGFYLDSATAKMNVFRNKLLRQAINDAINKEDIVKYLRNNIGLPAQGFVPPILLNEKVNEKTAYNPRKAKELITKAGYPEGKGLPVLILYITAETQTVAEAIQQQLSAVGIPIKLSKEQPAVLNSEVLSGNYAFFKKSWVGDYPDAENFLELFYSKNFSPQGVNFFHYSNPRFDSVFEAAEGAANDSVRTKDYKQLDSMVIEDAPVIPLYYDEVIRLVSKKIKGLPINPLNSLDLRRVRK